MVKGAGRYSILFLSLSFLCVDFYFASFGFNMDNHNVQIFYNLLQILIKVFHNDLLKIFAYVSMVLTCLKK